MTVTYRRVVRKLKSHRIAWENGRGGDAGLADFKDWIQEGVALFHTVQSMDNGYRNSISMGTFAPDPEQDRRFRTLFRMWLRQARLGLGDFVKYEKAKGKGPLGVEFRTCYSEACRLLRNWDSMNASIENTRMETPVQSDLDRTKAFHAAKSFISRIKATGTRIDAPLSCEPDVFGGD